MLLSLLAAIGLGQVGFVMAQESDFTTDYQVYYTVDRQGITEVTQQVTLVNNVSDRYVSEYTVNLGAAEVYDFYAEDNLGRLATTTAKADGSTQVNLKFNEQIVGKGKQLSWKFGYKSKSLAEKTGLVWEINLPKISAQEEIRDYQVFLKLPKAFGPEIYLSPSPSERGGDEDWYEFRYHKEQLQLGGVSAAFGDNQVLNFDLRYHLQNPQLGPVYTEVAFLPDISSRQKIVLKTVEPAPLSVRIDEDGNYMAKYRLEAESTLDLAVTGHALVFSPVLSGFKKGNPFEIPLKITEHYTTALPFWEADDSQILEVATAATRDKTTVYDKAQSLYQYVTESLDYSQSRVKENDFDRRGALAALRDPANAICLDYADLLIALLRAAGIPAREVNGYAYTRNVDFLPSGDLEGEALHAWVEYYEPYVGWIPIDPTWGSTSGLDYFNKLDSNHLAFVRKGLSSQDPYPAGAYKTSDEQKGDVKISFGTEADLADPPPKLELTFVGSRLAWLNQATEVKFLLKNSSLVTAYDAKVSLETSALSLVGPKNLDFGVIPPWGEVSGSVRVIRPSWQTWSGEGELSARLNWSDFQGRSFEASFSHWLKVNPVSYLVIVSLAAVVLGPVLYGIWRWRSSARVSLPRPGSRRRRLLRGRGQ